MRLAELTSADRARAFQGDIDITGIATDSRAVKPGYLFAALSGSKTDGAQYIEDALSRGAAALLVSPKVMRNCPLLSDNSRVAVIVDSNPRRRLARIAARFYGPQPEIAVAVTGTNGKTSIVDFTRQIWLALGRKAASIGTLGVLGDCRIAAETYVHTTPPPEILYSQLAALATQGVTHVAVEASSHGLAQYRLDGMQLRAAALTNIARDHLDYHADERAYMYAKLRLFGEVLAPGGAAVLSREAEVFSEAESLSWARGQQIVSVGGRFGDLRLLSCEVAGERQHLRIGLGTREWEIDLALPGRFQAMNALMAAALVISCGEDPEDVFGVLPALVAVPGRLELVGKTSLGAPVFVDYAHTPDALRAVLETVRPHCRGRLRLVFGCGGDRDRGKRPMMGAVAQQLADEIYVTDDNPRSEQPETIRAAICAQCPSARDLDDRRGAIALAISEMGADDLLVIAGKGHETGQQFSDRTEPFDDRLVAADCLAAEAVKNADRGGAHEHS